MNGESFPLIPKPVFEYKVGEFFEFSKNLTIYFEKEFEGVAKYLQKILSDTIGLEIPFVKDKREENQIIIVKNDDPYLPFEGYVVNIGTGCFYISGISPEGVFYGIQTLRQLLVKNENGSWEIPNLIIRDYPRFSWRGFMLDEARHFMGKEIVKHLLDLMALHKLNKFHWHLVDDQGWRVEIKKYPKLIEIGSKRKIKTKRGEKPLPDNEQLYGGFYTQEDIKEIIAYAKDRFIEIIPEIELPGHSSSAIASYPELSCTGKQIDVPTKWGILSNIYCAGKKNVYKFLEDVLSEIADLFPSEIIHVGGDEVLKKNWKKCPDCQAKMQKENMQHMNELHVYMTNHFTKFLKKKGKIVMGWGQILDPKLTDDVICQFWLGKKDEVYNHLRKGGKMVSSDMLHTYLDYPYFLISLKKAYNFDPILKNLDDEFHENILGLEAPLWTERVSNLNRLYYQVFPRLTAYAETAWSIIERKNFKAFMKRLSVFSEFLEEQGVSDAMK
ncbi:MAG: beta-N-acetylhexosaminidase [Asgard group archaeon]|nr:beta-N-acetylhexosaminidase [Asgard group archaeon]